MATPAIFNIEDGGGKRGKSSVDSDCLQEIFRKQIRGLGIMPDWTHLLFVAIPSLAGAFAGVFLPRGNLRFALGWIGAGSGFAIGFVLSLLLDPPRIMNVSFVVVTIPTASMMWGFIPYLVALSIWQLIRLRKQKSVDLYSTVGTSLILNIPAEQCSYQSSIGQFQHFPTGDCFFGVPKNDLYGRCPLKTIPAEATGFHFYLGAEQQSLFDSFVDSQLTTSVRSLHIGNSSYELGKGLDYSQLTASLARADFPKLETLELGVWQLFCNSHCAYGIVGCIDALAARMPKLKWLAVYGKCELQLPLSIPELEILHVIVDDPTTGLNGGALDTLTVSNLLSSSFPKLREIYIDLEIDDEDVCYSIPRALVEENLFPNLTILELVGRFRTGDKQLLLDSPTFREKTVVMHLDKMVEPQ